jgi:hypothetical protein
MGTLKVKGWWKVTLHKRLPPVRAATYFEVLGGSAVQCSATVSSLSKK